MTPLTRRRLLASVGIGGLTAAGLAAADRRPAYTSYTYAQSSAGGGSDGASTTGGTDGAGDEAAADGASSVRVAWYATYNGHLLDHQGGSNDTAVTAALDPEIGRAHV